MSKQEVQVFDFITRKTFRKNSVTVIDAILRKIDANKVKIESLCQQIADNFENVDDSVACMIAMERDRRLSNPKVILVDQLVNAVCLLHSENEELGYIARNMHNDSLIFYDLGLEDLEKYGL